ncbi:MAG TPA: LuxR C-terminal-related transcriptional regulator, partial [Candidatus Limnocylindria bacterium]
AAALPIADLVVTCPYLALLVTGRVPLRLRWEQTLRVAPLPVPDCTAPLPPPDALLAVPSVALFVSRARARQADFVLREQDTQLVAQLMTQLDGLPLALELAAARLDVLPLPTLARRLGDRLQLLASEAPDLPERQRSLEAAVGWSYDLLPEPERRLFRCLGVFVGRVSLDAVAAVVSAVGEAEAVAGNGEASAGQDRGRTLQGLLSLAEKSLLLPAPAPPNEPAKLGALHELPGRTRQQWPTDAAGLEEDDGEPEPAFGLLETVREYAWERLAAEGELAAARLAHARYFLALAERAEPALRGRDQRSWFPRLEREHHNLRAALRWSLDQVGPDGFNATAEQEAGLRLAGALGYFWYVRGYHAEGRRWLEEAVARAPRGDGESWVASAARTRALIATGPLLMMQEEYARAQVVLKEALALAERRQDTAAAAWASTYLGHATVLARDFEEGTRRLREAVRCWEGLGDPHGLGETLFYLGYAVDLMGDMAAAAEHYAAALVRLGEAGNAQHAGFVHSYLGVVEWRRGKLTSAVGHIQAVLQTSVALRDRWLLSFAAQATVPLVRSRAEPDAWERLLGAADALGQATGGAASGWEHSPGAELVVDLREPIALEGKRSGAYREGRTLPFAEVAALALRMLDGVALALPDRQSAPASARSSEHLFKHPSSLTSREQEVLRLVAEGLSSKGIAGQLFLAPSTVNYHLRSVFNKLGVDTRAQAVAVAARRGLV